MRLIMMATGPFALPTLEALYGSSHAVAALVTQPAREEHTRRASPMNPLRLLAASRGTPILDPPDVNAEDFRPKLVDLSPDLLVVADYGQLLSSATLSVARLGGINLHGSLLPRHRGAAPVQWAVLRGDTETGVTVIHMTPRLDAGPCIAQARTPIGADETAEELETRLARLGAPLVVQAVDQLASGQAHSIPQDPAMATRAPRIKKNDGAVDWCRSAVEIKNQVRALQPWPTASTYWHRSKGPPLRLILLRVAVDVAPDQPTTLPPPGTVIKAERSDLVVGTGAGALRIETLQPENKRPVTAEEFLRGYAVRAGDVFAPSGAS